MARPRKLTHEEEELIYKNKIAGISIAELAFKNGVSAKTIERTCKRVKALEEKKNG